MHDKCYLTKVIHIRTLNFYFMHVQLELPGDNCIDRIEGKERGYHGSWFYSGYKMEIWLIDSANTVRRFKSINFGSDQAHGGGPRKWSLEFLLRSSRSPELLLGTFRSPELLLETTRSPELLLGTSRSPKLHLGTSRSPKLRR